MKIEEKHFLNYLSRHKLTEEALKIGELCMKEDISDKDFIKDVEVICSHFFRSLDYYNYRHELIMFYHLLNKIDALVAKRGANYAASNPKATPKPISYAINEEDFILYRILGINQYFVELFTGRMIYNTLDRFPSILRHLTHTPVILAKILELFAVLAYDSEFRRAGMNKNEFIRVFYFISPFVELFSDLGFSIYLLERFLEGKDWELFMKRIELCPEIHKMQSEEQLLELESQLSQTFDDTPLWYRKFGEIFITKFLWSKGATTEHKISFFVSCQILAAPILMDAPLVREELNLLDGRLKQLEIPLLDPYGLILIQKGLQNIKKKEDVDTYEEFLFAAKEISVSYSQIVKLQGVYSHQEKIALVDAMFETKGSEKPLINEIFDQCVAINSINFEAFTDETQYLIRLNLINGKMNADRLLYRTIGNLAIFQDMKLLDKQDQDGYGNLSHRFDKRYLDKILSLLDSMKNLVVNIDFHKNYLSVHIYARIMLLFSFILKNKDFHHTKILCDLFKKLEEWILLAFQDDKMEQIIGDKSNFPLFSTVFRFLIDGVYDVFDKYAEEVFIDDDNHLYFSEILSGANLLSQLEAMKPTNEELYPLREHAVQRYVSLMLSFQHSCNLNNGTVLLNNSSISSCFNLLAQHTKINKNIHETMYNVLELGQYMDERKEALMMSGLMKKFYHELLQDYENFYTPGFMANQLEDDLCSIYKEFFTALLQSGNFEDRKSYFLGLSSLFKYLQESFEGINLNIKQFVKHEKNQEIQINLLREYSKLFNLSKLMKVALAMIPSESMKQLQQNSQFIWCVFLKLSSFVLIPQSDYIEYWDFIAEWESGSLNNPAKNYMRSLIANAIDQAFLSIEDDTQRESEIKKWFIDYNENLPKTSKFSPEVVEFFKSKENQLGLEKMHLLKMMKYFFSSLERAPFQPNPKEDALFYRLYFEIVYLQEISPKPEGENKRRRRFTRNYEMYLGFLSEETISFDFVEVGEIAGERGPYRFMKALVILEVLLKKDSATRFMNLTPIANHLSLLLDSYLTPCLEYIADINNYNYMMKVLPNARLKLISVLEKLGEYIDTSEGQQVFALGDQSQVIRSFFEDYLKTVNWEMLVTTTAFYQSRLYFATMDKILALALKVTSSEKAVDESGESDDEDQKKKHSRGAHKKNKRKPRSFPKKKTKTTKKSEKEAQKVEMKEIDPSSLSAKIAGVLKYIPCVFPDVTQILQSHKGILRGHWKNFAAEMEKFEKSLESEPSAHPLEGLDANMKKLVHFCQYFKAKDLVWEAKSLNELVSESSFTKFLNGIQLSVVQDEKNLEILNNCQFHSVMHEYFVNMETGFHEKIHGEAQEETLGGMIKAIKLYFKVLSSQLRLSPRHLDENSILNDKALSGDAIFFGMGLLQLILSVLPKEVEILRSEDFLEDLFVVIQLDTNFDENINQVRPIIHCFNYAFSSTPIMSEVTQLYLKSLFISPKTIERQKEITSSNQYLKFLLNNHSQELERVDELLKQINGDSQGEEADRILHRIKEAGKNKEFTVVKTENGSFDSFSYLAENYPQTNKQILDILVQKVIENANNLINQTENSSKYEGQLLSILLLISSITTLHPEVIPYLMKLKVQNPRNNPLSQALPTELNEISFFLFYITEILPLSYPLSNHFLFFACNVERDFTIPVWYRNECISVEEFCWEKLVEQLENLVLWIMTKNDVTQREWILNFLSIILGHLTELQPKVKKPFPILKSKSYFPTSLFLKYQLDSRTVANNTVMMYKHARMQSLVDICKDFIRALSEKAFKSSDADKKPLKYYQLDNLLTYISFKRSTEPISEESRPLEQSIGFKDIFSETLKSKEEEINIVMKKGTDPIMFEESKGGQIKLEKSNETPKKFDLKYLGYTIDSEKEIKKDIYNAVIDLLQKAEPNSAFYKRIKESYKVFREWNKSLKKHLFIKDQTDFEIDDFIDKALPLADSTDANKLKELLQRFFEKSTQEAKEGNKTAGKGAGKDAEKGKSHDKSQLTQETTIIRNQQKFCRFFLQIRDHIRKRLFHRLELASLKELPRLKLSKNPTLFTQQVLEEAIRQEFNKKELYFVLGLLDEEFETLLNEKWRAYSVEVKKKLANYAKNATSADYKMGNKPITLQEVMSKINHVIVVPKDPTLRDYEEEKKESKQEEEINLFSDEEVKKDNKKSEALPEERKVEQPKEEVASKKLPEDDADKDEWESVDDEEEEEEDKESGKDAKSDHGDDNEEDWESGSNVGSDEDDGDDGDDEEGKEDDDGDEDQDESGYNKHSKHGEKGHSNEYTTNTILVNTPIYQALKKANTLKGAIELDKLIQESSLNFDNTHQHIVSDALLSDKQVQEVIVQLGAANGLGLSDKPDTIDPDLDKVKKTQRRLQWRNAQILYDFVIFLMHNPSNEKRIVEAIIQSLETLITKIVGLKKNKLILITNQDTLRLSRLLDFVNYYNKLLFKNIFVSEIAGANFLERFFKLLEIPGATEFHFLCRKWLSTVSLISRHLPLVDSKRTVEFTNSLVTVLFSLELPDFMSSGILSILRGLYSVNETQAPGLDALIMSLKKEGSKALKDVGNLINAIDKKLVTHTARLDLIADIYLLFLEVLRRATSMGPEAQIRVQLTKILDPKSDWMAILDELGHTLSQLTVQSYKEATWLKQILMIMMLNYCVIQVINTKKDAEESPFAEANFLEVEHAKKNQMFSVEFLKLFGERNQHFLSEAFLEYSQGMEKQLLTMIYNYCPWILSIEDKRSILTKRLEEGDQHEQEQDEETDFDEQEPSDEEEEEEEEEEEDEDEEDEDDEEEDNEEDEEEEDNDEESSSDDEEEESKSSDSDSDDHHHHLHPDFSDEENDEDSEMDEQKLLIRREKLLDDTIEGLRWIKNASKKGKVSVNIEFFNEPGIDQGGLKKEWLSLVAQMLFNPTTGLFRLNEQKTAVFPSRDSLIIPGAKDLYTLCGYILAFTIEENTVLDISLSTPLIKLLLGRKLTLEDLEELDSHLYGSLRWMLTNSIEGVGLTDEYQFMLLDKRFSINIFGEETELDDKNKKQFITRVAKLQLYDEVKNAVEYIREGLTTHIPKKHLDMFLPYEFSTIISGKQFINKEELKKYTKYNRVQPTEDIVRWFWEIVDMFSQEELSMLIFFITGSPKVAVGGFKENPITITRPENEQLFTENLPVAHTCYSELELPNYPSKEVLHNKLMVAIVEGREGFHIV